MLLIIILVILGLAINYAMIHMYAGFGESEEKQIIKRKRITKFRKAMFIILFIIPFAILILITLFTVIDGLKYFWNNF